MIVKKKKTPEFVAVRLSTDMLKWLVSIANAEGLSVSAVIRRELMKVQAKRA